MNAKSSAQRYYLFKAGQLHGPIAQQRLDDLRSTGELLRYSWIMNESEQTWTPVEPAPRENPFNSTQKTLNSRDFSGAFVFGKHPYLGEVKGIHSFGLELLVPQTHTKIAGLLPNTVLQLNLADETHDQAINTEVVFQQAEEQGNGVLLRFGWVHGPAQL
jgi:hypothetical protein